MDISMVYIVISELNRRFDYSSITALTFQFFSVLNNLYTFTEPYPLYSSVKIITRTTGAYCPQII